MSIAYARRSPSRRRAASGDVSALWLPIARVHARMIVRYMRDDGVRAKIAWANITGQVKPFVAWKRVERKIARLIADEIVRIKQAGAL